MCKSHLIFPLSSRGCFCRSFTASRTWSYSGCWNVWVSLCPFGSEMNCTTPAGADQNLHKENHGRTLLHTGELRARVRQEPKEDWPLSPSIFRTGSDGIDGPITLSVWTKPSVTGEALNLVMGTCNGRWTESWIWKYERPDWTALKRHLEWLDISELAVLKCKYSLLGREGIAQNL